MWCRLLCRTACPMKHWNYELVTVTTMYLGNGIKSPAISKLFLSIQRKQEIWKSFNHVLDKICRIGHLYIFFNSNRSYFPLMQVQWPIYMQGSMNITFCFHNLYTILICNNLWIFIFTTELSSGFLHGSEIYIY